MPELYRRETAPALDIAMVSPEIAPLARTGGLGDVLGSLPQALKRLGLRVSLIMPAYRYILHGSFPLEDTGIRFALPISSRQEEGSLLRTKKWRALVKNAMTADFSCGRSARAYLNLYQKLVRSSRPTSSSSTR